MPRKPEPLDLYTVERWHDEAEAAERARIAAVNGMRSRGARRAHLDLLASEASVRAFLWGVLLGAAPGLSVAVVLWWLA